MLRYAIILQIALTGFSVSSHACSTASIGGWDAWQIANEVVVGTVVDIKTFNTEGLSKVGTDYPGSVRKYMRDTPYHDRPWAVVEIERAPRSQTGQSERMELAWTILRWYLPAMPEIGQKYTFAVEPLHRRGKKLLDKTSEKTGLTYSNLMVAQRRGCYSLFFAKATPENLKELQQRGFLP